MTTHPPAFPRFVPTLTEVVDPLPLLIGPDDAESTEEALIRLLSVRMTKLLEQKLTTLAEELIQSLLSDHLKTLTEELQPELDIIARQTLYEASLLTAGEDKPK